MIFTEVNNVLGVVYKTHFIIQVMQVSPSKTDQLNISSILSCYLTSPCCRFSSHPKMATLLFTHKTPHKAFYPYWTCFCLTIVPQLVNIFYHFTGRKISRTESRKQAVKRALQYSCVWCWQQLHNTDKGIIITVSRIRSSFSSLMCLNMWRPHHSSTQK